MKIVEAFLITCHNEAIHSVFCSTLCVTIKLSALWDYLDQILNGAVVFQSC